MALRLPHTSDFSLEPPHFLFSEHFSVLSSEHPLFSLETQALLSSEQPYLSSLDVGLEYLEAQHYSTMGENLAVWEAKSYFALRRSATSPWAHLLFLPR